MSEPMCGDPAVTDVMVRAAQDEIGVRGWVVGADAVRAALMAALRVRDDVDTGDVLPWAGE